MSARSMSSTDGARTVGDGRPGAARPSGFELRATTMTPRPRGRGQVEGRLQRAQARGRARRSWRRPPAGWPGRARPRRRPPWSIRCRRAWRRRWRAGRRRGQAASTSSRAARPADPIRSKKATWGLTTGTTPANASTQAARTSRRPSGVSARPQAAEQVRRRVDARAQRAGGGHRLGHPVGESLGHVVLLVMSVLPSAMVGRPTVGDRCPRSRSGSAPMAAPAQRAHGAVPGGARTTPRSRRAPARPPGGPGRWPCPPGRRRPRPCSSSTASRPVITPPTPMMVASGWAARTSNTARTAIGWMRRARQPATGRARPEDRGASLEVDDHGQCGVDQGDRLGPVGQSGARPPRPGRPRSG